MRIELAKSTKMLPNLKTVSLDNLVCAVLLTQSFSTKTKLLQWRKPRKQRIFSRIPSVFERSPDGSTRSPLDFDFMIASL